MEIRRAMALFRINDKIPIEELNTVFRGLVKKYHPDKVHDFPDWAHERMAEINDAYETLVSWIAAPPKSDTQRRNEPHTKTAGKDESANQDQDDFRNTAYHRAEDVPPLFGSDRERFNTAFSLFLDGLGLYYQYGLDNPAYRTEGVRRFRFREAFRMAARGSETLEECSEELKHPAVEAASRFARLAVADIDLGRPIFDGGDQAVRRLDERFRSARRMLDEAVKVFLFPELVPEHLKTKASSGLYACYAEFVVFLTTFTKGERRKAGILASARYDSFMDLLEFKSSGHLEF